MTSFVKNLLIIFAVFFCCSNASAADYATFESFYNSGIGLWGWTFIIGGSIVIAVITLFTFGGGASAAPAWMASVGTWIGSTAGLSGIAAANYGLALLGGGAVASGGLGIAGGVAALTFGTELIAAYAFEKAFGIWDQGKFIEDNKKMIMLPIARNESGGKAYKEALTYLGYHYRHKEEIFTAHNQKILNDAIYIVRKEMGKEEDKDYILKNKVLLSLLLLQTNQFAEAEKVADEAIILATERQETPSLPGFIKALSELATPEKPFSKATLQSIRTAYYLEEDNPLIPIMTASCMDRMMYKYHFGEFDAEVLSRFFDVVTNEEVIDNDLAASSLCIFVTRCLVELKVTQQDIYAIAKNNRDFLMEAENIRVLNLRLECHKALIELLNNKLDKVRSLEDDIPDDFTIGVTDSSETQPSSAGSSDFLFNAENLKKLLNQYQSDLPNLEKVMRGELPPAEAPSSSQKAAPNQKPGTSGRGR